MILMIGCYGIRASQPHSEKCIPRLCSVHEKIC